MKKLWLVFMLSSVCVVPSAHANDVSSSAGLVLNQVTSVRAEGMGGAQAAVATDEAGSIGWNPACLQNLAGPDLSAVYYRGIGDNSFGAINYSMSVNQDLMFGAGVLLYDSGPFELNSDTGESTSVLAQRDIQVSVTSAYDTGLLASGLVLGVNGKFLQSTLLEKYSAFAAALDFGARLTLPGALSNLQVGAAIKNLGTPIKYIDAEDPLPTYALLGLGYTLLKTTSVNVLLAGDAHYDLDSHWQGNVGSEFRLAERFVLRGGYKFGVDIGALTLGAGVEFSNLRLDYTFSPSQVLNSTHIASLKYAFDAPVVPKDKRKKAAEVKEADYMPEVEDKKAEGSVAKIRASIVQVRKAGGRPSEVIMNGGAEQEIRVGFQGVLVDRSGRPLAAIVIRQVDPKISLADVIGMCRDIDSNVIALIEKPVSSTPAALVAAPADTTAPAGTSAPVAPAAPAETAPAMAPTATPASAPAASPAPAGAANVQGAGGVQP